ncbi:hypothetical protein BDM02DRAFT_3121990 [Thelephora ganbajun]|uniref:Uncharacterized protein n=1 Tax=Thelephora ganbajun TaxID=370292 RepID=A0ACB6Z463_THEGA|nr:hypothetical protein BDM02DRAFT_3121990 [Thelephora ganbajun]
MPTPSDSVKVRYGSTTTTGIIVAVSVVVTLFYLVGLYLVVRRWARARDDTSLNKYSSTPLQRSISFVYLVLVLTSIANISISAWILAQYDYNHNHPLESKLTLFCGCWTTLVAGCYSFLLLHPKLSRTPIALVGVQAIWLRLTFPLWAVSAGFLGALLPCNTLYLVYCRQLKALFAISVVQSVFFGLAMVVIPCLRE